MKVIKSTLSMNECHTVTKPMSHPFHGNLFVSKMTNHNIKPLEDKLYQD